MALWFWDACTKTIHVTSAQLGNSRGYVIAAISCGLCVQAAGVYAEILAVSFNCGWMAMHRPNVQLNELVRKSKGIQAELNSLGKINVID